MNIFATRVVEDVERLHSSSDCHVVEGITIKSVNHAKVTPAALYMNAHQAALCISAQQLNIDHLSWRGGCTDYLTECTATAATNVSPVLLFRCSVYAEPLLPVCWIPYAVCIDLPMMLQSSLWSPGHLQTKQAAFRAELKSALLDRMPVYLQVQPNWCTSSVWLWYGCTSSLSPYYHYYQSCHYCLL